MFSIVLLTFKRPLIKLIIGYSSLNSLIKVVHHRAAAHLLAFWYSHQHYWCDSKMFCSECFGIARGVMQGGILSTVLV